MDEGVVFPVQHDGRVSTTLTGKAILASSVKDLDQVVAERIMQESNWRYNYPEHFVNTVKLQANTKDAALTGARKGLEFLYENFYFQRNGKKVRLSELQESKQPYFETVKWKGKRENGSNFAIETNSGPCMGEASRVTVSAWLNDDLMEVSAMKRICWTVDNEISVKAKLKDVVFVIFGCGSAIGPFSNLMRYGATIAAIDLPNPKTYERLFQVAEESSSTIFVPEHDGKLGCNLITQVPEIVKWLIDLEPEKMLVLGNYAYADGATFIRVALAMDCISMLVARNRSNIALSYLCSPTDCFKVAQECKVDSKSRYEAISVSMFARPLLNQIWKDRFFSPNYDFSENINEFPIVIDNFILEQGPNYSLAKRLQQWRAIMFRQSGFRVSCNIAPASLTESVTKNFLLKAAYGGTKYFSPTQIFTPEATNSAMTLLLLYDIFSEESTKSVEEHPFDMFISGSIHGGMFRNPYRVRSVSEIAAILYLTEVYGIRALFILTGSIFAIKKLAKL